MHPLHPLWLRLWKQSHLCPTRRTHFPDSVTFSRFFFHAHRFFGLVFITLVFSEREICHRPSVCLSSVTFVHPTQAIDIFGNASTPCGTLAILDLCIKKITEIVPGEPLRWGLNPRGVAKYSDFRPFEGYNLGDNDMI